MTKTNIALSILAVALLLLILFFSSSFDFRSTQKKDFNGKLWKEGSPTQRATMAHNLIQSDTLKGLNYREVRRLLGEPDLERSQVFIYNLDFGHRWWPGERWYYQLSVHFDSLGVAYLYGYSD